LGAFIESNSRFPVGQKVLLAFKLPNYHEAFRLDGRIARSGPRGIGVKFYDLSPDQEDAIHEFIDSKK
jgi:Tfp pilus assembly protein PilZ